jgi:Transcriptional regulators
MTTIRDVAARAQVAVSTVSRVINGTGYVSEKTRARVLKAMEELNFRPNEVARSLKRRQTRSLGLAITDISNPFFGEVAHAVEIAARSLGYSVLFASTGREAAQEAGCIDLFLEKRVDGIIWFAPRDRDKLREVMVKRRVPVVVITPMPDSRETHSVYVNDARGAYEAVSHLLRLGHRKIGYIAEPDEPGVSQERLRGYRWALNEYGLELDPSLIVRGTFSEGAGSRAVDIFFRQRERAPTAIFAANDLMAIEAMSRLRSMGLRVPQDVAVVGFDDVKMAGLVGIDLTTVAQPKQEMGREAALMLIDAIANPRTVRQVVFTPYLVIRKSCGYYGSRGNE